MSFADRFLKSTQRNHSHRRRLADILICGIQIVLNLLKSRLVEAFKALLDNALGVDLDSPNTAKQKLAGCRLSSADNQHQTEQN